MPPIFGRLGLDKPTDAAAEDREHGQAGAAEESAHHHVEPGRRSAARPGICAQEQEAITTTVSEANT